MCGIVGYIGKNKVSSILINGLKRLEYRGYDSAGISLLENGQILTLKKAGKVAELENLVNHDNYSATIGIAHTRWATHGEPNDLNAHPHFDNSKEISIVHNGIIENYSSLKKNLLEKGYFFNSDTDTEVLAVLIGHFYKKTNEIFEAVRLALNEVTGTFGLVVMTSREPGTLIAARRGSPMVFGIGNDEYIIASDASAIIAHTNQVIYINDNEMINVNPNGFYTKTIYNEQTNNKIHEIEFDLTKIEKGGFAHFMLKEIYEQPNTFKDSYRGRIISKEGDIKLGGLRSVAENLRNAQRIIITACGTSWHSALVGEYLIENLANIPVEVEYASEFRYRNPIINKGDIVFVVSQSGETADTLAAIKEAKQKGAIVIGIVNQVGSSIARETDAGMYIHAGPEIGVASTKAFTSQVSAFILIALYLGRMRNISKSDGMKYCNEIALIPDKMNRILEQADQIKIIADHYSYAKNFLYLGRGYNFPVALEGALKLKEISYIHAEGYPAAEMKHGPIALIDDNMPVVFIATKDEIYEKVISNIEEVKARGGKVIAIATEGDENIKNYANHIFYIPEALSFLTPLLAVIPLQLLSYYMAVNLGRDVDQPRNLAKSVTVE